MMSKHSKKAILAVLSALFLCLMIGTIFAVNTAAQETAKNNELLARYDTSHDCIINIADVSATLNHLSQPDAASNTLRYDSNRDGQNGIADVTALLNFLSTNTEEITATLHAVTYKNKVNNAAVPQSSYYAEHIGVEDLPDLEAPGYRFKGWSTKMVASDADLIDTIESGSNSNYTLYAQWDLIEYKIYYKNSAENPNVTTYTIEDEVRLENPSWEGLRFAYWTDEEGNRYDRIPKGTIGDIELTANWRSLENIAVPYSGIRELWTDFDKENGHQVFVYPLGEIQNVVLKRLDKKSKTKGGSVSWSEDTTVSFDKGTSEEISKAVTNSTSTTTEHSTSEDKTKSHSDSFERGFTIGAEVEFPIKVVQAHISAEGNFQWSDVDEESWSNVTTDSKGETTSFEETLSNSSTVTYNHTFSETFATSYTVENGMPEGTYEYVYYGTIYVFAVVTYEPSSGNYRMDTYSVLNDTDIGATAIYTPPVYSTVNVLPSEGLPYDFSWYELDDYMKNTYYIQYNAGGGSGKMPTSVCQIGEEITLPKNKFTKYGYTFRNWELQTESGGIIYTDEATKANFANSGETITLKAKWDANTYSIKLDPNNGTLSYNTKTVTYGEKYGSLPTPTRTGYTFTGWKLNSTAISSSSTVYEESAHTLVAQWKANIYTITYHGNGSTDGSTSKSTHTYDQSKTLNTNGFSRTDWVFLGWSTNKNATAPTYKNGASVSNLSSQNGANVNLYAVWLKTKSVVYFTGNEARDVTLKRGASHSETVSPAMNKQALLNNEYTKFKVTVSFDAKRTNTICFNGAYLYILPQSGQSSVHSQCWHAGKDFSTSWANYSSSTSNLQISGVNSDGSFVLLWETHDWGGSKSDGWYLGATSVTIEAIK